MVQPGYLLVYSDPGEKVALEEFTDWYDNEHVPLRIDVPAFQSWHRWAALDGKHPRWAASYDLTSFKATLEPPYSTLAETRSEREKGVIKDLETLDRRTYELLPDVWPTPSASYDPAKPAPFIAFVAVEMKPEAEEDYNKWYDEEHIPLLSKCAGWVRSRRFVLKDWSLSGTAHPEAKAPPKYLAVHEWMGMEAVNSEEYKTAMTTPWRDRVMKEATGYELRVFKHYRSWDKQ